MLLVELLIEAKMVNRNGVSVNEDSPRIWSDQKVHYKSNLLLDNFCHDKRHKNFQALF